MLISFWRRIRTHAIRRGLTGCGSRRSGCGEPGRREACARVLAGPNGMGYGDGVKMTFEIPDALAERFKTAVPAGTRSPFVAALIDRGLGSEEDALEAACRKANTLKLDMADWEKLNESATW